MNVFRLIGDLLHLLSFFILIKKIHGTKNVIGLNHILISKLLSQGFLKNAFIFI